MHTEHATHQLQPIGSLPLAQKCIALVCMHAHCVCAYVYMYMYVCTSFFTYTPYSPSPGPASPVSKETPADHSGDVEPAHQDPITTMDTSQSVQYVKLHGPAVSAMSIKLMKIA